MIEPFLRIDEKLSQMALPELVDGGVPALTSRDCLVVCSGFEERALAVLNQSIRRRESNFLVLSIEYLPVYSENRGLKIEQLCQKPGVPISQLTYDRENPSGIGEKVIEKTKGFKRVFVDISGMSRLLITQIIVALGQRPDGFHSISLFYAEANNYPPSQKQFEEKNNNSQQAHGSIDSYISSGVYGLEITPELSSVSMQGQAIRLIAFPSFNKEQLAVLLQEIQPTFVDLLDGLSPRGENSWRLKAIRELNKKTLGFLANTEKHELSTLDYRETFRFLLEVYQERSAFDKIVIAPIGSKMQTIAVALFRTFMNDIQIVYPTPQEFNEPQHYTQGVREIYRLDLGSFKIM